ncbi:N-acetylmuramoyl-L-alanine amidase [Aestuariispira insulae]|nr:N-acetylmuramoyl-L-alanine amidase [Aestuariispira insulae]
MAGLFLCLLMLVVNLSGKAFAAKDIQVNEVRIGEHAGYTRFVVDMNSQVPYEIFTLSGPYRVVIDLPELNWAQKKSKPLGLVAGYRYGLFRPGVSRIVIDTKKPVAIKKHFRIAPGGKSGHRVVIDIIPVTDQTFAATSRKVTSPDWPDYIKRHQQRDVVNSTPAPTPAPEKRKPMIILDPGHGGPDPGAIGSMGTYEKKVTLSVAKAVKAALEKSGRYRVRLTRDRDFYIPLRQRYQVAEKHEADLFVSLHADKIDRRNVRGASVYTLSENASDKEAAKLAAKENKSDLIAGVDLSGYDEVVARTLLDFEQRATMEQSWHFAEMLVKDLGQEIRLLRNTHRFAGFAVLKSPTVPSVLIELGYLSNRKDEKLLRDPVHHRKIGSALLRAVDAYFRRQNRLSRS